MSGRGAPARIASPAPARAMTARLSPLTLPCLTTSSSSLGTSTTTSNASPASIFCLKAAARPNVMFSLCPDVRSNSGARSSKTSRRPFEHSTLISAARAPPTPSAAARPASASHIAPTRMFSSRFSLSRGYLRSLPRGTSAPEADAFLRRDRDVHRLADREFAIGLCAHTDFPRAVLDDVVDQLAEKHAVGDLAGHHVEVRAGMTAGEHEVLRPRRDQHRRARLDRGRERTEERSVWRRDRDQAVTPRPARRPVDEIGRADEVGDEPALWRAIDLLRAAALRDAACLEHRDLVRQRQRFRLVVCHVDRGDAEPRLQALELDAHLLAQLGIEV